MPDLPITVLGAGLAGSLMSIYLARRGLDVQLYERRADLRRTDIPAGRSINLALSTRGITALAGVGLADAVLADAIPMRGRRMHARDGSLTFQPYGKAGQAIQSVSRRRLNEILLDAAEAAGVTIAFEKRCVDLDPDEGRVTLRDENTGRKKTVQSRLVIGADGAFSAVRERLAHTDRFSNSLTYLDHGYKELTIPPAEDGSFRLEPNALHIWPRHDFMMIALPNPDATFTCTLFLPFEGETSFAALDSDAAIRAFFEREFPDAVPLMPTLLEDFRQNPTSSLAYVKCAPYRYGRQVLLIGDAAHAVVPFYGQGMNAAFEDCTLFDAMLARRGVDAIGDLLAEYSRDRKADADAICELALQNFVEMRSRVANPAFLLRKQVEKKLHAMMPDRFVPLYSMVTFSNIPYAEARARAAAQDRTLQRVARVATAVGAGAIAGSLVGRKAD